MEHDIDLTKLVEELSNPANEEYFNYCYGKPKPPEVASYPVGSLKNHPDIILGGLTADRLKTVKGLREAEEQKLALERRFSETKDRLEVECGKLREEYNQTSRIYFRHRKRLSERIMEKEGQMYTIKANLDDQLSELRFKAFVLHWYDEVYHGEMFVDPQFSKMPEFGAKAFGEQIGRSYVFSILYRDQTHDSRPCPVSYALIVPAEKKELIKAIAQNPEVLIEVYRRVFKGFDNSQGKLRILEGPENRRFKDVA